MSRRAKRFLQAAWPLAAAALVFYAFRRAGKRGRAPDLVDEASLESFPASDPPSWTSAALQ